MFEASFDSEFYNEKSFRALIESSPFKQAELIREGMNYFWILRK